MGVFDCGMYVDIIRDAIMDRSNILNFSVVYRGEPCRTSESIIL
jgi:hypothetical protein